MLSGSRVNDSSKRRDSTGQDMISNLPEFIIAHILSFLYTKEAVITSVLSKRWKYMWTFITKLNFCDFDPPPRSSNTSYKLNSFHNFVTKVLSNLKSKTIQEFYLSHRSKCESYYISRWISSALNRRVKKVNVSSWNGYECDLSYCLLFECQSLEELAIRMMSFSLVKVPSFVCLPLLTVLELTGITLTYNSSNHLKELTLNFPLLREYKTCRCTWFGIKSITIEAPLLELVELFTTQCEIIKFCASHIAKFSYRNDISSQTILLDDQHIPSAKILVSDPMNERTVEEIWIFTRKLLSLFIKAESLELNLPYRWKDPQDLAQVEHYLAGIPAFRMLGHLQLDAVTSDALLSFLLRSPCLKTLVLKMEDHEEDLQDFAIVPDCFLSTLKVVKFDNFFGGERELSFAKFVMENAKVLERIAFSFHPLKTCLEMEKAKEKLNLLKISFSTIIMKISP